MVLSCRLYSGASEYVVETSTVTALPASSLFASVVVKRDLLTLKAHSSTTCMYIKTTIYWHACLRKKEYICGQWTHFSRRSRRQPRPNTGSHHQDGQASAPACWVDVATGVRRASLHREIYLSLSGCGQVALMRVARDAPDVLQLESFNKVVQPSTFFH